MQFVEKQSLEGGRGVRKGVFLQRRNTKEYEKERYPKKTTRSENKNYQQRSRFKKKYEEHTRSNASILFRCHLNRFQGVSIGCRVNPVLAFVRLANHRFAFFSGQEVVYGNYLFKFK